MPCVLRTLRRSLELGGAAKVQTEAVLLETASVAAAAVDVSTATPRWSTAIDVCKHWRPTFLNPKKLFDRTPDLTRHVNMKLPCVCTTTSCSTNYTILY